jgi:hypothetical protein
MAARVDASRVSVERDRSSSCAWVWRRRPGESCSTSQISVAQCDTLCSTSNLAEALRLSIPWVRQARAKTGSSARPTRTHRYQRRPSTNSETLSDGRMVDRHPSFLHEFFDVACAQGVGDIPADPSQNDLRWEMGPLEAHSPGLLPLSSLRIMEGDYTLDGIK